MKLEGFPPDSMERQKPQRDSEENGWGLGRTCLGSSETQPPFFWLPQDGGVAILSGEKLWIDKEAESESGRLALGRESPTSMRWWFLGRPSGAAARWAEGGLPSRSPWGPVCQGRGPATPPE